MRAGPTCAAVAGVTQASALTSFLVLHSVVISVGNATGDETSDPLPKNVRPSGSHRMSGALRTRPRSSFTVPSVSWTMFPDVSRIG